MGCLQVFSGRTSLNRVASAADMFAATDSRRLETQPGRLDALGHGQRHHKDTIAVGSGCERPIHGRWQVQLAVVRADGPFVDQQLAVLLDESWARVARAPTCSQA